ncbi:MAG: MarR family transcriptional regulator [Eubacterium sp.]
MKKGKKEKNAVVMKKDSKKEPVKKNKPPKKKKNETKPDLAKSDGASDLHLKEDFIELALLYQNFQDIPKRYGSTTPLYSSEINALEAIAAHPGLNLTAIAADLNISKSAVSKCTGKLIEKKLVIKERSTVKVREVVFNLTEKGQQLYQKIIPYKESVCAEINEIFEALDDNEKHVLNKFSTDLKNALNISLTRLKDN